jgi:nicotinamidase/pyrazinamidase
MRAVFFDIDTQLDFVSAAGALYVPGAEEILPAVAALNRLAGERGIPLISTMDAHTEDDPEFKRWPHHCVAGALGQRKPVSTLLGETVLFPSRRRSIPLAGAKQILLEKQTLDAFTNENLPGLLAAFAADGFVVYGVVTEICVRIAALELLKTGKRVEIVEDAVRPLDGAVGARTLADFRAAGGVVVSLSEVCGRAG